MRRGLLRGSCGLAFLASLAAASVAATPAAGRAVQLTPVEIAMLRVEPAAVTMYAKHRGMFRKQGIDATITPVADPFQLVASLTSGDVQFVGVSAGTAASLKSRDAPVKVVAAGGTYNPKAPNTALVAARGKAITRARDLVGKTIAVDGPNTIAHLGVLEWLEKSGVDGDDVKITFIPFAQMLGALAQGTIDAALVPEPWRTLALQQGAKHIAYPWNAVCAQTCVLAFWIAQANVDSNLAARLRNAIQNAALWANQRKNDEVSGKILAKYVPMDAAVLTKMTRTTFATRLRVSLAKPWLDVFAKYGVIPASFKPGDLVK